MSSNKEWLNKLCYSHTMKSRAAFKKKKKKGKFKKKKNEEALLVLIWKDFQDRLREKNKAQSSYMLRLCKQEGKRRKYI